MLQQSKILLLALIFHIVLSNYEGYEIDSTTSHEICTEPDETASDSNCYCYSQPETDFEYSICAPKKCQLDDANYQSVHGRCFYFENERKTFVNSRENCKSKGGKLYEPKDVVELNEIAHLSGLRNWFWIGLRIIYNDSIYNANYVYDSNNQSINFDPPWYGNFGKRGGLFTCIRVLTGKTTHPNVGKMLDNDCTTIKVFSICEL